MTDTLFNYSSVVVDDLASSAETYEKIGVHRVWEGTHPLFKTRGVLLATQKGGTLLLERTDAAHPAVAAYAGKKERNFHIGLVVADAAAQRALCEKSRFAKQVSESYAGPAGASFMVELDIAGKSSFWVEFTEGLDKLVGAPDSEFECVDSTAMVAARRDDLLEPFRSLGLEPDRSASDGYFDVLAGINAVVLLDWHYLEVNEPTKDDGVMVNFLGRIGQAGIFGTNYVPRSMDRFVERAREYKLDTNTEEPILLMVEVHGKQYKCANIITINPRATGGARIFILQPLEYPWQLAA